MINLPVDEAYAFDFLSVLDVKRRHTRSDQSNFDQLCADIADQIGPDIFHQIMKSKIYEDMVKINEEIYDLIDVLRQDIVEMDAKVVDDANIQRYKLKKRLQDEFFMTGLTETKTRI